MFDRAAARRGLKYGVSYPFLFAGAGLIVAVVIGIFKIRKSIEDNVPNSMRNYIIGIITAISINVLNVIFRPIARILNDWENHRTESAWERHLILKLYTFSFINNFITLFYLAFIEPIDAGRTTQTGLNPHPNKTMGDLSAQLGTIMITKQVLSNFMEIGLPWIQRQLTKFILRRKYEREERDAKQLTKLEKQHKMPYFDLFEEFQEIAIQFGYVTLFAAAFPAAPLWALINNVFEIRIDAFNLVSQQKRPPWNRAADIGAWYNILEVTAFLSVFTNSMIIGYSSGQVTSQWGLSGEDAVWALFLVEHIVFVVKFVVMGMIPDTPKWVEKETSGISRWRERKLLTDVLNDENRAEIDLSAMVPRYEGEGTSAHDAVAEPAGFYADGAPMPDRA